jgi:Rrf2 family nitric oxide-sensitive transcriptional repressor
MRRLRPSATLTAIMQLTRFTDYALRVLLFVGKERGRRCTMGEIAAYYRISAEHLRKVVHCLAKLGYLQSIRGKGGGLLLGRDAQQIRLGEVIVAMEQELYAIDCHALECVLLPNCSLQAALKRGSLVFVAAMNDVTLANLLGEKAMMRQLQTAARAPLRGASDLASRSRSARTSAQKRRTPAGRPSPRPD